MRKRGEICLLDIVVTETDAKSYKHLSSRVMIKGLIQKKKKKYLDTCVDCRKTFMPLSYALDGIGKEPRTFNKRIATIIAEKWGQAYSEMCDYVWLMTTISIVQSNTLLLCRPH